MSRAVFVGGPLHGQERELEGDPPPAELGMASAAVPTWVKDDVSEDAAVVLSNAHRYVRDPAPVGSTWVYRERLPNGDVSTRHIWHGHVEGPSGGSVWAEVRSAVLEELEAARMGDSDDALAMAITRRLQQLTAERERTMQAVAEALSLSRPRPATWQGVPLGPAILPCPARMVDYVRSMDGELRRYSTICLLGEHDPRRAHVPKVTMTVLCGKMAPSELDGKPGQVHCTLASGHENGCHLEPL